MPGFNITGQEGPSNTMEVHRDHRWRVENFGLPMELASEETIAWTRRLHLYAKSLDLPSVSFEEAEIEGASIKYKVATKATFEPVTLTMYDVIGMHKIFDNWQKLIWTPQAGIQPANKYVGEPRFSLLDGAGNVLRTYTLINAYPKSVTHSELSYQSSELKLLKIVYSYGWMELDLSSDTPSNLTRTRT